MVSFYFYLFSSINSLFYSAVHGGGLVNSGTQNMTSLLIQQNNDKHLAQYLHNVGNIPSTEPVNIN
jgi:hypothetical protein